MKIKAILLAAAISTLTACASTPVQETENRAPAQAPNPLPQVVAEAQPTAPVQQTPLQEAQPYAGPPPGSIDHFRYVSGDDRVYFAYNQYDLSAQARDTLRKQAQWLSEYSGAILVIGGHADERGTREYNLALGARRAEATKAFLISQGVNPSRMTTVSYGKERPIDGASTEAAWARNRNSHSSVLVGGNS